MLIHTTHLAGARPCTSVTSNDIEGSVNFDPAADTAAAVAEVMVSEAPAVLITSYLLSVCLHQRAASMRGRLFMGYVVPCMHL